MELVISTSRPGHTNIKFFFFAHYWLQTTFLFQEIPLPYKIVLCIFINRKYYWRGAGASLTTEEG